MVGLAERAQHVVYIGALCTTAAKNSVFISFDTEDLGYFMGCREYHMKNPGMLDLLLFWDSTLRSPRMGDVLYKSMSHSGLDIVEIVSFLKSNGSWDGVE